MAQLREAGRRWGCAFGVGVLIVAAPQTAGARPGGCEPVRIAEETVSLPAPWREALDALARATAKEGMPWSCPGGSVDLKLDGSGAVLTVTDARGRVASRRVPSPDELAPTAEALLAAPTDAPPTEGTPPPRPDPPRDHEPPRPPEMTRVIVLPAASHEPRLHAQALVGARVGGPGMTGWATGQLRGILPIGPWSVGFWVRYDLPFAGPPNPPQGFEMDAISAGFAFGRRLASGPFELRASIDPSLAVVMMESGLSENVPHPEGAKIAFRIGTMLSGAFRIAGIFRGVVALDGEFAPAGIGGGLRKIDASLPAVPVYTVGILLGVEATIR